MNSNSLNLKLSKFKTVDELMQKWINALKSEKYEQNAGSLRNGNKFCCLGVLCDVVDSSKWDDAQLFQNNGAFAPIEIDRYIKTKYPQFRQKNLSDMNDDGASFNEIANYIENFCSINQ